MLWPATAAVPWPITRNRVIVPSASFAAISGGRARSPTTATKAPSSSVSDLAAQGLGEARRRLGDLLEQIVRRSAAIDVARRHLGRDDVLHGDGDRRPVVGEAADARTARRRTPHRSRRSLRRSRRPSGRSGPSPRPRRTVRSPPRSSRRPIRRRGPARSRAVRGAGSTVMRRSSRRWPPTPRTSTPSAGTLRRFRCRRRGVGR